MFEFRFPSHQKGFIGIAGSQGSLWRIAKVQIHSIRSTLLLIYFQIQGDVLAAVKTRNGMGRGLRAFLFCMNFVGGIWIEAAKAVLAGCVRVGTANYIRAGVLQKDNAFRNEGVGFVLYGAVNS